MMYTYDAGVDNQGNVKFPLHRNENLFVDRAFIQELAEQALRESNLSLYPDSLSLSLRKAIGKCYGYDPEEVYVGNGADGVLADLLHLLRDQYEEVGTQEITYRIYPYLFNRYKFRQRSFRDINGLWVIDSPNSITGEIFDSYTIEPEFLICDNVYGEWSVEPKAKQRDRHRVTIQSFSKFYGLASLRIGYCFAPPELVLRLLQRKDAFNVNGFAQKMAELALLNREYFSSLVPKIEEAKKQLREGLLQLGFSSISGHANFLWVTHPKIKARTLQKRLSQFAVQVRHFSDPLLENGLRITVPQIGDIYPLLKLIKISVEYDDFSSAI